MSGVTGEIGYKVDAAGAARTLVGVQTFSGTVIINGQVVLPPSHFANPTNKVSTIGTNGTGTTAMRSDAAPAIDQAMTPSWTGQHVYIPGANTSAISVQSSQNSFAALIQNLNSPGFGLQIQTNGGSTSTSLRLYQTVSLANILQAQGNGAVQFSVPVAGTATQILAVSALPQAVVLGTSTGYAWGTGTSYPTLQLAGVGAVFGTGTIGLVLTGGGLYYNGTHYIYGQAGTGVIATLGTGSFTVSCVGTSGTAAGTAADTVVFSIGGTVTSNKIQGYGPNAAALVDMTPDTGSFVVTLTGCTTAPTGTCYWARNGNIVVLALPAGLTGTSNANTMTLTGLPAGLTPTRTQLFALPEDFMENGGALVNTAAGSVGSDGSLVFYLGGNNAGWGTTLIKGFGGAAVSPISYILN